LVIFRFAVAIAAAALITYLGWREVPHHLVVRTDIVGYPIFANFDIDRYIDAYYLVAILFPLLSIGLYQLVSRWGPLQRRTEPRRWRVGRETGSQGGQDEVRVEAPLAYPLLVLRRVTRLSLVAATVGAEVYCAEATRTPYAALFAAASAAVYVAAVILFVGVVNAGGWNRKRVHPNSFEACASSVNAYGAIIALPLLYYVSLRTSVTVTSDGTHHLYPWFPIWILVPLVLVEIVVVRSWQLRGRRSRRVGWAEAMSLVWVVGPVLVFLLTSLLPGSAGASLFEGGQSVASAQLIFGHGLFPWRDLYFIHGLLGDPLASQLGLAVFGATNWGATAGGSVLLVPACWVAIYAFAAYMYGQDRLFLVGVVVAIVLVTFLAPESRFLVFPLQLIIFAKVLRSRRWWWVVAFVLVTVAQCVATPETGYAAIALGGTLIGFEWYSREPGSRFLAAFDRTRWMVLSSVLSVLALAAFLAAEHALRGFIDYFVIFAPGHQLTGGLPIAFLSHPKTVLSALLPVMLVLLTVWLVVAKVRGGKQLVIEDWVTVAAAGFVLLYYTKELARDDTPHVLEVLTITLPLIILWSHRLLRHLDIGALVLLGIPSLHFRGRPTVTSIAVALGIVVAVVSPPALISKAGFQSPVTVLGGLADRYHPVVASEPQLARLGYTAPGAIDLKMVRDLASVLDRYAGARGPVFDFTNDPLLTYFLLNRVPGTSFFVVSMAQPALAQQQLISQLEQSKPKVVIFNSPPSIGLPAWDGITNMVRHYEVSQYLLDNYRPLMSIDGQLLFIRDSVGRLAPLPTGLSQAPNTDVQSLYFDAPTCSWGYAPNFLAPGPVIQSGSALVLGTTAPASAGPASRYSVSKLTLAPGVDLARYRWLVISYGKRVGNDQFVLADVAYPTARQEITFESLPLSGNRVAVPVGSCLQWHGYGGVSLYLRSTSRSRPTKVELVR
jgi:hypothetical protein